MSIGKFAINFVVAFVLFYGLHTGIQALFPEQGAAMMAVARSMEAPEFVWLIPGHALQTIAYVWLFMSIVKTQCWKAGAMFGFVVGLMLAATDLVYYSGFPIPAESIIVNFPTSVLVSTIVGAVLGMMNKQEA